MIKKMQVHEMSLDADAFERIKLGKKKIEVRLLDEKRKRIERRS